MPCFLKFLRFFVSSHSKRINRSYHIVVTLTHSWQVPAIVQRPAAFSFARLAFRLDANISQPATQTRPAHISGHRLAAWCAAIQQDGAEQTQERYRIDSPDREKQLTHIASSLSRNAASKPEALRTDKKANPG